MSARPIGSATVTFGMVSIPIKLYSTSESAATISFNWLHKACNTRLKQQYVCPKDNAVVERDDMIKGYEYSKGKYVLFTPKEIENLGEQKKETIDIKEFVPADQVERMYYDKAYYLGPEKGGDRAYRLLSQAMRETGLSALGRYSARGKQYLVMVRPMGEGLVMEQLHYADELRPFSEVPLGEGEVNKDELKLAIELVKQRAADAFEPQKYEDEVKKRIQAQIEKKIEDGQEIQAAPEEEPKTQVIDLMAALKASLAKSGGPAEQKKAAPRKRKARSA
jgi:DNA end-binding protein Ku